MGIVRRITLGWKLGMGSWRVLLDNKVLMIFPILSLISTLIVFGIFATGGALLGIFTDISEMEGPAATGAYLVGLLLVYTVFNTITIFFNVAMVSSAARALSAQPASIGSGLADALSRMHYILMWALVSSTVSVLLSMLERQKLIGRIVSWILGGLWSILTYLVLPVLAFERVGPFTAIKRSTSIIVETWGEGLGGRIGVGLISFLMILPAVAMAIAAAALEMPILLIIPAAWVLFVLLWSVTANSILQVAVYAYACNLHLRTDYFPDLEQVFYGKGTASSTTVDRPSKMEMIRDGQGDTELHNAVDAGNIYVVEAMVKRGADLWAKGLDGRTPYERALVIGQNDIAQRLRAAMEARSGNVFEKQAQQ